MYTDYVVHCLFVSGSHMKCILTPHFWKTYISGLSFLRSPCSNLLKFTEGGIKKHDPVKPRSDSQLPALSVCYGCVSRTDQDWTGYSQVLPQPLGCLAKALWGTQKEGAIAHPRTVAALQTTQDIKFTLMLSPQCVSWMEPQ